MTGISKICRLCGTNVSGPEPANIVQWVECEEKDCYLGPHPTVRGFLKLLQFWTLTTIASVLIVGAGLSCWQVGKLIYNWVIQ